MLNLEGCFQTPPCPPVSCRLFPAYAQNIVALTVESKCICKAQEYCEAACLDVYKMYHLRASGSGLCSASHQQPCRPRCSPERPSRAGPGASALHCQEVRCSPGKTPHFQQTTLQFFFYKGLPHAWQSIIEQLSFLCRLYPFTTNSKNL